MPDPYLITFADPLPSFEEFMGDPRVVVSVPVAEWEAWLDWPFNADQMLAALEGAIEAGQAVRPDNFNVNIEAPPFRDEPPQRWPVEAL